MRLTFPIAMSIITSIAALVSIPLFPLSAYGMKLSPPLKLTPHRAVYEVSLANASNTSGIAGLRGRLVFELGGSSCDGYTVNMRFVTQITNQQGTVNVTDLRTSTWESGAGKRFRFNSSEYANSNLNKVVRGDATRKKSQGPVNINLKKPAAKKLRLKSNVLFPTQHSISLIQAARQGRNVLQADIYDGSEKGAKVYTTTAIIGKLHSPGNKGLKNVKNSDQLNKISSWPVSIGYYDKGVDKPTPSYQIAFRLFENGVSRKLYINYGEFSIHGVLKNIEFFKPAKCQK